MRGYEIDRTLTLEESVNLIAAHVPIVFPPGTQLAYEGAGMQIIGRICEVVTGKSWHTLAAGLLFQPLGMTESIPTPATLAKQPNVASPHFVIDGKVDPSEEYRVLGTARDRQQQGQLPPGTIKTVKRVR